MYNDPRGVIRTAVSICEKPDATYVELDCGHIGAFNASFHYKLGDKHHCFQCGQMKIKKKSKDLS